MLKDKRRTIFLLLYLHICWFLIGYHNYLDAYTKEKTIAIVIFIITLVLSTALYHLFNSAFVKTVVLLISLVVIAVFTNFKFMLSSYAALAAIYIYKIHFVDKANNENIKELIIVFAPLLSITSILLNFNSLLKLKHIILETIIVTFVFVAIFLVMGRGLGKIKIPHQNKTNYKKLFLISIIGVISSASSFIDKFSNIIVFYPWFLFITLLLYHEDKLLESIALSSVKKIKKFLQCK